MGTRAEELRRHRKCFEYGLQHGITPREAELELQLQAARDRARALTADMEAKNRAARVAPAPIAMPDEPRSEPWMMRD
jgi:hypothetical protein